MGTRSMSRQITHLAFDKVFLECFVPSLWFKQTHLDFKFKQISVTSSAPNQQYVKHNSRKNTSASALLKFCHYISTGFELYSILTHHFNNAHERAFKFLEFGFLCNICNATLHPPHPSPHQSTVMIMLFDDNSFK